tara:strand:- start:390 stop:497 length:108 start_codon:yes stop_codon:yes gene_type:complete
MLIQTAMDYQMVGKSIMASILPMVAMEMQTLTAMV